MTMTVFVGVGCVIALAVLIRLLYLSLFHVDIPRMIRRFQATGPSFFGKRFAFILRAFLTGNNLACTPLKSVSEIREALERDFESFYRGFAYEGTGMGFGARSSMRPNPGRRFERYISILGREHLYQYYVGLGWYLHIRYGYRPKGYAKWLRRLDPRYASIVFDGVGFRHVLFANGTHGRGLERIQRFDQHYQRICFQGMGRGLWFVNGFDLEKTIEAIQRIPCNARNDAYSGLGIAVAYSLFDNLSFASQAELKMEESYRTAFRQGLAFGWEARKLQNEAYWAAQMEKFSYPLSHKAEQFIDCVHSAKKRLDDLGAAKNDHYYCKWMDETRILLGDAIPFSQGGAIK